MDRPRSRRYRQPIHWGLNQETRDCSVEMATLATGRDVAEVRIGVTAWPGDYKTQLVYHRYGHSVHSDVIPSGRARRERQLYGSSPRRRFQLTTPAPSVENGVEVDPARACWANWDRRPDLARPEDGHAADVPGLPSARPRGAESPAPTDGSEDWKVDVLMRSVFYETAQQAFGSLSGGWQC